MKAYYKIPILLSIMTAIAFLFSVCLSAMQHALLSGSAEAKPFHFLRIFSRSLTIVLFFSMIFYVRKVENKSLINFGLAANPLNLRMLFSGFVFGIASMLLLIFIEIFISNSYINETDVEPFSINPKFYYDLFLQLLIVFLIGTVEEWFFRGYLLQSLEQDIGVRKAVIVSSLFFALCHFIRPVENWGVLLPEFLGLFLIGIILAKAAVYSHSLYLSIGIHAGWVYVVKLDKYFVNHFDSHLQKTFGGEKLLKSISAWILILLILAGLKRFVKLIQTESIVLE